MTVAFGEVVRTMLKPASVIRSVRQETKKEKFSDRATQVGEFPRALRRTAYATAIITFASHEANAPILTPHIPAMIAAATMALIATQTPQRRSALR